MLQEVSILIRHLRLQCFLKNNRHTNEQYPGKSVALLKKYLPAVIDVEIEYMGHGQYLHEHSDEYVSKLIEYLQS